jgi:hypothetical protein
LALECKQLSSQSAQTYERLAEDPELRTLESQTSGGQAASSNGASAIEATTSGREDEMIPGIMHGSATSPCHKSKVMEVTQGLQPVQDVACILFEEIEGRGAKLEQVVTTMEQRLEGPMTEKVIQEFIEQEALAKQ